MKRPLDVLLRDEAMQLRRGVTVQLRCGREVQYAVTDLDGVARFRIPTRATVKSAMIVVDEIASEHELQGPEGQVRQIEIVRRSR